MSVSWTKEQQKVIDLRGLNILVSAAAGSGKTAVLVERIIKMLTEETQPADVDELLVVTFTEAAAAEMKDRIRAAIEKKMEAYPGNEHLRRQATLIHSAQITTIHSFCLNVIREHFHAIDLDPGFRIGEEGELKLLGRDVLEEVLESWYADSREDFVDFTESYAGGRDDRKLEELVLKLYEFSRSYPDPEKWLKDCVRSYDVNTEEELIQTEYFCNAIRNTRQYAKDAEGLLHQGIRICQEMDGPYMYQDILEADYENVAPFLCVKTYTQGYEAASRITWKRLSANRDKNVSSDKADQVKRIRERVKKILKDITGQYFTGGTEEVLKDLNACKPMVQVLVSVTQDFAEAFEARKRQQNIIDFEDMQQYALRILTVEEQGVRRPSKVAKEYQQQFREVMIDEYQDSNLIQEAILTSVSRAGEGQHNIFMVGDVKQSIYRFRLSRPELFMEKFHTYNKDDKPGNQNQRIDLHKNFRSRGEVLDSVNGMFQRIMTESLGGITYDDEAALYVGAKYPDCPGNETEVILIDTDMEEWQEEDAAKDLTAKELEARAIAERIKKLMDCQQVVDKSTGALRPVRYSDIVILVRSMKGYSDVFAKVLTQEGIPSYAGTKEGYFETREIGVLLDYLRVLNNRYLDIPLAAVLSSYFGGISNKELAEIKSRYPELKFSEAVFEYAHEDAKSQESEDTLKCRLKKCVEQMEQFRSMVPYMAIHELLWRILLDTGYGDYVSAMPGGSQRKANVDMLVEKAIAFENTSYKGLFNFVRYIEQLQKYDVDYGEAGLEDEHSDIVRIMSIHKSKGLEFPVVLVAGMGKRFNQMDARGQVLLHASLGAGLDSVNLDYRVKSPSFLKKVIQREEVLESLGEELRVLYVALTRAKEKLIIMGTLKEPAQKLNALEALEKSDTLSFEQLASASSYWDFILPALVQGQDTIPVKIQITDVGEVASSEIEEEASAHFTRLALESWDTSKIYDQEMCERLEEQFSYRHPHDNVKGRKLKFTVSELKKRSSGILEMDMADDAGELLYEEPEIVPLIPCFMRETEESGGASRGSAYHRVLELIDYTKDYDEAELIRDIQAMIESGRLAKEMAGDVRIWDIMRFLSSSSANRMKHAAKNGLLFKEQPFVLGVPMDEIYLGEENGETVLIQGIIDVYFEESDGLAVLDYKTDRVDNGKQLIEKYHAQLDYYAKALEQLTGKKVKDKIIYSFALREEINL